MNNIADKNTIIQFEGFVPVINLRPARQGDRESRLAVARAIGQTCESSGFFVITGHGVPDKIVNNVRQSTKDFFALSHEEKASLLSDQDDPLMRGFGRDGSVAATNDPSQATLERQNPDLAETYTISRPGDPGGVDDVPGEIARRIGYPNKWPRIAHFEQNYRAYYQAMETLAREIMQLFALSLNLPENWFDKQIDRHMTNLTANYYPAQKQAPAPGQLRKGKHSDWGSLTILQRDEAPGGLQVLNKQGEWQDVPNVPDSFVINIGDLMAIWTNNRWVSTVHRVVNPPREYASSKRYSIAFFHQPNFDAVIESIPGCSTPDNPSQYAPVLSGEYIMEKFRLAY